MRSTTVPRFGRQRWGYLLTSRGCPYLCTFCSPTLRQSYGRPFRSHSAERVVDDMLRLHHDHGVGAFYMIDDVFSFDRARVAEMCHLLIRRQAPISWVIQTRPDFVDPELLRLLKQAGCAGVKMGIESGVDRILKMIKKGTYRDRIAQSARDIREAGLFLTAYYMLGHPTETLEEMEETYRFARRVKADMIQVAFHTPYPGSQSYRDYQDDVEELEELNHYETHHVNRSAVDGATLERTQRRFYLRYYFSPATLFNYARRRLLYRFSDPSEWRLAFNSLKYLLLQRGRSDQKTRSTAAARGRQRRAA